MDIRKIGEIKEKVIHLRSKLLEHQINVSLIVLFGSYAQDQQKKESDIDIAVVSLDFGKDRIEEGALLNLLASDIDPRMELIPISVNDYLSETSSSPLLYSIKTEGIPLL